MLSRPLQRRPCRTAAPGHHPRGRAGLRHPQAGPGWAPSTRRPRPSPGGEAAGAALTFLPKTWTLCRGPLAGMMTPARERGAGLALWGAGGTAGPGGGGSPAALTLPRRRRGGKGARGRPAAPQGRPRRKVRRASGRATQRQASARLRFTAAGGGGEGKGGAGVFFK